MKSKKAVDVISADNMEAGKTPWLHLRILGTHVKKEACLGSQSSKVSGSQGELSQTVNLNDICLPGWILKLLWANAPISLVSSVFLINTEVLPFSSLVFYREQRS